MEQFLKIGRISKPQGIRGELKVEPLTDDLSRFLKLKEVIIDGTVVKLTAKRLGNDCAFISLFGVSDRNAAENFRGKFLYVSRENAVELKPDSYFIADIIGIDVFFEDGEVLGKITDVTSAKTDYFTLETVDGKTVRFPFLKDLLCAMDIKNGKMTIYRKRFSEVACFED